MTTKKTTKSETTFGQPAPVANDSKPLWQQIIDEATDVIGTGTGSDDELSKALLEDMAARDKFGFDKYGVHLQANNGRNFLKDAYEESLDLCVYLKGLLVEEESTFASREYVAAVFRCRALKRRLMKTEVKIGK